MAAPKNSKGKAQDVSIKLVLQRKSLEFSLNVEFSLNSLPLCKRSGCQVPRCQQDAGKKKVLHTDHHLCFSDLSDSLNFPLVLGKTPLDLILFELFSSVSILVSIYSSRQVAV